MTGVHTCTLPIFPPHSGEVAHTRTASTQWSHKPRLRSHTHTHTHTDRQHPVVPQAQTQVTHTHPDVSLLETLFLCHVGGSGVQSQVLWPSVCQGGLTASQAERPVQKQPVTSTSWGVHLACLQVQGGQVVHTLGHRHCWSCWYSTSGLSISLKGTCVCVALTSTPCGEDTAGHVVHYVPSSKDAVGQSWTVNHGGERATTEG